MTSLGSSSGIWEVFDFFFVCESQPLLMLFDSDLCQNLPWQALQKCDMTH